MTEVTRGWKFQHQAMLVKYDAIHEVRASPADQEKTISYNELAANAAALQNVVVQTRALHTLKSEARGPPYLTPYATRNLKRFGDNTTELKPEPAPQLGVIRSFRIDLAPKYPRRT